MPFDRSRYPADWEAISRRIRERSGGRCEGPPGRAPEAPRCEARNGAPHPRTGSRVVLTTAHVIDPDPMNVNDWNLAALCQRCHLNHDRPHHVRNAARRRRERRACGDLFAGPYQKTA